MEREENSASLESFVGEGELRRCLLGTKREGGDSNRDLFCIAPFLQELKSLLGEHNEEELQKNAELSRLRLEPPAAFLSPSRVPHLLFQLS